MSEPSYATACAVPHVSPEEAAADFDGRPGSIARARSLTWEFLAGLPGRAPVADDDIVLVVCELVTNAVRHTPGPCTLVLAREPAGVRVEVHDTSTEPPRPRPPDLSGAGGQGWHLVTALSASVAVRACAHGKAVTALVHR